MSHTFALATDDMMLFTVADGHELPEGRYHGQQRCDIFDQVLKNHNIQASQEKDVNGKTDTTCIGIDVCEGRFLAPSSHKLAKLLCCCIELLVSRPEISPLECSAILGVCTWFALLNRPSFSIFGDIYNFVKGYNTTRTSLPANVLSELLLFVALSPLLEADLSREWIDKLVATDASGSFGFGVSTVTIGKDAVRELGHIAERPGQFVRLLRDDPTADPAKPRKGVMHSLPFSKSAFKTVVMSRANHKAHSGALESTGVALGLRWLLRSPKHHGKRAVFLIDAQAVLSAVNKGRSSAPSFRREIAHISALCLASDIMLKTIYVPSEDNPADEPSRGVLVRRRLRGRATPAAAAKPMRKVPVKKPEKRKRRLPLTELEHCNPYFDDWRRLVVKMSKA